MSEENELPEGWIEVSISGIAELVRGVSYDKSIVSDTSKDNYIPILRATNIQDEHLILDAELVYVPHGYVKDEQLLQLEDVVICMSSGSKQHVGKTAQLNQEWHGSFGTFCSVARFNMLLNRKFAGYFFQSTRYRELIREKSSGININNLRHKDIEELLFPIPPLSEQQRIVDAIEEQFTILDATIAMLQADKVKLKNARTSVLKYAVEGKLTEQWRGEHPTNESAQELLARILRKRREKWEAEQLAKTQARGVTPKDDKWKENYKEPVAPDITHLDELPEGWCWTNLGQCFEVHVGSTPRRNEAHYWNGDIPWVSSGEVQFCRIQDTKEYITQEGLENSSTQINPIGSILLGMIGEGRTRGQVAFLDIAACNSQNSAAIWVSQTPISPEYIYYYLWSQYEVTREKGSGNSQPALNKYRVEQLNFPLPSVIEQQQIVAEVEERLSLIEQAEQVVEVSLKRAERARQSILKRAFAGQLVPQNPDDEPASVLLERIQEERAQREIEEREQRKVERMATPKKAKSKRAIGKQPQTPLFAVLVAADRPLAPDDLFQQAGLKADVLEDVDSFYEELRDEVVTMERIREVRPTTADVLLEPVSNEAQ